MLKVCACRLLVYALTASDGSKFKLRVPMQKTVKDLKTYLLHEKAFPMACQTLFQCKNKTHLELLKDDAFLPKIDDRTANAPTLHLYITKSAQQKSLEKTRQSDFDDWLKRLKKTNISPYYKGNVKLVELDIHQYMTLVSKYVRIYYI